MRITCSECNGNGKSTDPFWSACWTCCGRGTIPETFADVVDADIGFGVGFATRYTRGGYLRQHYQITGTIQPAVLGMAPRQGREPFYRGSPGSEREFFIKLLNAFRREGRTLTLAEVMALEFAPYATLEF